MVVSVCLLVWKGVQPQSFLANMNPLERAGTSPSPCSIVRFLRAPDFAKRGLLSDKIHDRLSTSHARLAYYGLGGVG